MALSTSFNLLKVAEIREETPDCFSIKFEVPENLKESYLFQAGQYLTLRHTINGEEVRRPFSICSAPSEGELRVAIKILSDGKFSGFVKDGLTVGTAIEVLPPLGKFTPRVEDNRFVNKHFLAFAAGSGITPILGIMKTILASDDTAHFTLVYGNKNINSIIFKNQIVGLKNQYLNRLTVHNVLSQASTDTDLFHGRITVEKVKTMQEKLIPVNNYDEVFVCGPEEMILSLREHFLEDLKFDPYKFHIELFTSPEDPKRINKVWEEKKKNNQLSGQESEVTILIDGIERKVHLAYSDMPILDKGIEEGMDLPYSCKSGVCTTCKAKLVEGEVDMEVNYGLEPDEIEKNYILTCQSHPKTPKVVVDYDI